MRFLVLDYETFSESDLKSKGAYEYSKHPSTEVLCAAWALGEKHELKTASVSSWRTWEDPSIPDELATALADPEVFLIGHNAYFEQVITKNVLGLDIGPSRWICTASLASALALPRSLGDACKCLGLEMQKDTVGRSLMLKWCKPRKPTQKDPNTRQSSVAEYDRLVEYCESDIKAEVALFLRLPSLNTLERQIWQLDQEINLRGFKIDRDFVSVILEALSEQTEIFRSQTQELTLGIVDSFYQRDRTLQFLKAEGTDLPDLSRDTVSKALKGEHSTVAKRILEIRKSVSKTSTAKYQSFFDRSESDGRIRDHMLYWGASTGRWSGSGVQVQNFPRGILHHRVIPHIREMFFEKDFDGIELVCGDVMEAASSCLRSVIIPSTPKHKLFCADYASIEVRVLFWVANHIKGLKAFEENRDLYKEMAAVVFRTDYEKINKDQRQLGKAIILGSGYGMGHVKFKSTCERQGIQIDEDLAQLSIAAYREAHKPVAKLWYAIENAALAAVRERSKKFVMNKTSWWCQDDFLWCQLPSGRRLAYYQPEIKDKMTPFGEKRPALYHFSVNPVTRQWESAHTYGAKLVENIVQGISRDTMAEAMLRVEKAGYPVLFSVHDEILSESDRSDASLEEFEDLVSEIPEWGIGIPLATEGWVGDFYHK